MTELIRRVRQVLRRVAEEADNFGGTISAEMVAECEEMVTECEQALAALETLNAEPVVYRYLFSDPISGKRVWRFSPAQWNGQRPQETQPLYTRLRLPAAIREDTADGRRSRIAGRAACSR